MGKWIWEELGEGKYDLVYCIKHLNERIKLKKTNKLVSFSTTQESQRWIVKRGDPFEPILLMLGFRS